MRRLALVVAIGGLVGGGCGFFDDAADPFDSLDEAQVELVALGRDAFGSDAVEVQQVANCIDQPASVWASWDTGDGAPAEVDAEVARTAEARGWVVDDPSGSRLARRTIDGADLVLHVEPAGPAGTGAPDVTLRAEWATDDDPC